MKRLAWTLLLLVGLGCSRAAQDDGSLRLGYFPNITHAQALVGADEGRFRQAVGPLRVKQFNAGPAAMEALLAGAIDVAYVGSAPAINAHIRSLGEVRIIAGAASGGAALISRHARKPEDLLGTTVSSPQIANSQDVALRHWLADKKLPIGPGPNQVRVMPVANADAVALFVQKQLEAAWVPEPWASRLLAEGGHLLVDERDLWPGGSFPTTVLVATGKALSTKRDAIRRLLQVHVELTDEASAAPSDFAQRANLAFGKLTRKPLPPALLEDAFSRLTLVVEPSRSELLLAASHAQALGYLPKDAELSRLIDDSLLQELLRSRLPNR